MAVREQSIFEVIKDTVKCLKHEGIIIDRCADIQLLHLFYQVQPYKVCKTKRIYKEDKRVTYFIFDSFIFCFLF